MAQKTTYISLETEDGERYRSSSTYISALEKLHSLEIAIERIKDRLEILEKPQRKQSILDLLECEGSRTLRFIERRVNAESRDLYELVEEGKIVEERHGAHRMFRLEKAE